MKIDKFKDKKYTFDEREYIYSLKVLAVISIVSAHCVVIQQNSNELNILFSWMLEQIGSIGVGVFYIISGYLFYRNKYCIKDFFKRKVKSLFIPWIVVGTGVYLYIFIRKGNLGISTWLAFILGDGSYLYFLTLLIIFYLIFFYYTKNNLFLIFNILVCAPLIYAPP